MEEDQTVLQCIDIGNDEITLAQCCCTGDTDTSMHCDILLINHIRIIWIDNSSMETKSSDMSPTSMLQENPIP